MKTLAELLKALVECEDQMERMNLVESNQELLDSLTTQEGGEEGDTGSTEDWETKYKELVQKYTDTFFGGTKTEEYSSESTDDSKDEETKRGETITIADLTNKEDK